MTKARASSTPVGTVLEIPLGGELGEFVPPFAYAIVTHQIEGWGQVVRIFELLSQVPLSDTSALEQAGEFFGAYIHIESALQQRLVRRVGNMELPSGFEQLPLIRYTWSHSRNDRWIVTQGDTVVRRDQTLTPELARLGTRGWSPLRALVADIRFRFGLDAQYSA